MLIRAINDGGIGIIDPEIKIKAVKAARVSKLPKLKHLKQIYKRLLSKSGNLINYKIKCYKLIRIQLF